MLSRTVALQIQGTCSHMANRPRRVTAPLRSVISPRTAESRLLFPSPTAPTRPTSCAPCSRIDSSSRNSLQPPLPSAPASASTSAPAASASAVSSFFAAAMPPWSHENAVPGATSMSGCPPSPSPSAPPPPSSASATSKPSWHASEPLR